MNGPEYRWRKRLDARAERRRQRRQRPTKQDIIAQLAAKTRHEKELWDARTDVATRAALEREASLQDALERQRPSHGILSGIAGSLFR